MKTKLLLASLVFGPMVALSSQAQVAVPGSEGSTGTQTQPASASQSGAGSFQINVAGNATIVNKVPLSAANPARSARDASYYFEFCDHVVRILKRAAEDAAESYKQGEYTDAKDTMVAAFQKAASFGQSGVFKPYTQIEVARSLELVTLLENSNARDQLIASVALNRAQFIEDVTYELDRDNTIPCRHGCDPEWEVAQYERKLVNMARKQLTNVQKSMVLYDESRGQAFPVTDVSTYFTVVTKAAQWAASDLRQVQFSTYFACAIVDLTYLGEDANSAQQHYGEKRSINKIYREVNEIAETIQSGPYCGGREHRFDRDDEDYGSPYGQHGGYRRGDRRDDDRRYDDRRDDRREDRREDRRQDDDNSGEESNN